MLADSLIQSTDTNKNWTLVLLRGVTSFVLLLGIGGVFVWHIRAYLDLSLAQFALTFHDDVALSFIYSGLAFIALIREQWHITRFFAVCIIVSNILAIIQNYFNLPVLLQHITQLLVAGTTKPVDVNSAAHFPFVLVGAAIWMLPNVMKDEVYSLTQNIMGAMIIALGLITFLARNNHILTLYGWGQVTYGSMTTALGLVAIGMAILATAWHRSLVTDSSFIRILPLFIIALIVVITLFLWQALLLQNNAHIRRLTQIQISSVKNEILARMQAKVVALERMAHRWTVRGGTPYSEWKEDASVHLRDQPGMSSLNWIDNDLVIRWVVPSEDVLHLKNLNALFESKRGEALIRASVLKHATMTHAVQLLEGKQGILIYVPLIVAHKPDGFLLAGIDTNNMFRHLLNDDIAPGYNIDVYDADRQLYHRGENGGLLKTKWEETVFLNLYGITWTVQLWPTVPTLDAEKTALPAVALIMGLVMALLLGLSIRFAQLAQKRAEEVEVINVDLKREIHSRERAEEAKREIEKLLLQNQKLQAIGTLAGGIAHDFNNILFSMLGYVDLALSDVPAESRTHSNLEKVMTVGKRAQQLVAQILSFSRQKTYDLKPVSVDHILNNALLMVQAGLPQGIRFERYNSCGEGQDLVRGSDTQLEQVFMNIIKNAADAMGDTGKLTIRISRIEADHSFIKLHPTLTEKTYLALQFQDTGAGMDEITKERIFEPFYTTKDVSKGTGLGMAIAHGIIQDHAGAIRVESALGVGTSFFVYLPAEEL